MHEFLRSIGMKSLQSKKALKELCDWAVKKPDQVYIIPDGPEQNLTQMFRETAQGSGISVVGETDETGIFVPEYYFPYATTYNVSSDSEITVSPESSKNGYIGLCEDYRVGMALIFSVKNIAEIKKNDLIAFGRPEIGSVCFSFLSSEGTVLLPIVSGAGKPVKAGLKEKEKLMREAADGNPDAIGRLAEQNLHMYEELTKKVRDTDVFSIVESFFMPHGMESDIYYLMGEIKAVLKLKNNYTGENFYRMILEVNEITLTVFINESDLLGEPGVGMRLKCIGWLQGEISVG